MDLLAPRFIDATAGLYESYYVKLAHPSEPRAVWIRTTVHQNTGATPNGSAWCTVWDGAGAGAQPAAAKQTWPGPTVPAGGWLAAGDASIGPAAGATSGRGAQLRGRALGASWELRCAGDAPPLEHLPARWLYRAPLPRTKTLSPLPEARFEGRVELDGRVLEVDGWPGMLGHNWGAEHAERWTWIHAWFGDGTWIDLAAGRVKVAGRVLPWVAMGAVSVRHRRIGVFGPARIEETPTRCAFGGRGFSGVVEAPRDAFVGWEYADPDGGGTHHTVNCSLASMELTVEGEGILRSQHATYELGMRERDPDMPLQPHPDG